MRIRHLKKVYDDLVAKQKEDKDALKGHKSDVKEKKAKDAADKKLGVSHRNRYRTGHKRTTPHKPKPRSHSRPAVRKPPKLKRAKKH